MSSLSRTIIKTLALVLVAMTSAAQSPSTPPLSQAPTQTPQTQAAPSGTQALPSDVTIKARTQVVLLDVVATDKKGHPITDLKKEEFSVSEQGKPQQIASFSLVDTAKRSPAPKGLNTDKLPAGVYSNHREAVAEEGQLIVLLLDALNTPWADQQYMRLQMLKYLEKNHQTGQKMAVFGLARTLIRLQDFTDDPEKLKAVIKRQKGETSPLLDDGSNDMGSPLVMDGMTADMQSAVQSFQEQSAAMMTDMRVRMTLDALKAIGNLLAGYPGRKKLIWVSGSFPISLMPGDAAGFQSQRVYGDDVMATTSLLRESQVAVYPIDPSGLVTLSYFDASRGSGSRSSLRGPQMGQQISRQTQAIAAAHAAARQVADETGGVAFYNRNDLDTAVMKSVADGAIYYALSYAPEDKNWNGRVRHIDVKVNRPGLELRYRKSYTAVDPELVREDTQASINREIAPALNTVLTSSAVSFFGSAQPLNPPAKTGSAPPAAALKLADIRFLVEPQDIHFQVRGDKRHCNIQFVAAVFVDDKLFKSADKQLECNVEPATYAKLMNDGMLFRLPVEVPEGKSRVRLLVRDNLTGKMGSLDVPYPPAASTMQLPRAKP